MKSYALGIDLGTTNSVSAYVVNDSPVVIPDKSGNYLTPSIVNLGRNNVFTVGETAKSLSLSDPVNTFFLIKRLIGLDPRSSKEDTKELIASLQFQVSENDDRYTINSTISPRPLECQEISARILKHLHEAAQRYSPEISKDCVVTVPAYFNNRQRVATKDAVQIAGLNLLQLLNEPTAAAIAYGLHTKSKTTSNVLVVDLGGGTFDISLVEKDQDDLFFVVATYGDSHLGGEDFTRLITDFLISEAKLSLNKLVTEDPRVIAQFREQAERAKCALSFDKQTHIDVPFLPTTDGKYCQFSIELTQAKMAEICRPLIRRVKSCLQEFTKKEQVNGIVIDDVVLAGGASRLPLFQEAVQQATGLKPKAHLNPDLLIAQGAAICAEMYRQGKPIQSLMSDVTPLTLGTEVIGGEFVQIIPANTSIPCSRTKPFTTVEDYQEEVLINVYQGERLVASENISLGDFTLSGIEIAKAGMPQLEVTYTIDIDGILRASCIDLATKSTHQIRIQNTGALSRAKIKELKEIARTSREKDIVTLRNNKSALVKHDRLRDLVRLFEKKLQYADTSEQEQQAYEAALKAVRIRDESFIGSADYNILTGFLDKSSRYQPSANMHEEEQESLQSINDLAASISNDQVYSYISQSPAYKVVESSVHLLGTRPLQVVTSDDIMTVLFNDTHCKAIFKSLALSKRAYKKAFNKVDSALLDTQTYRDLPPDFMKLSRDSINLLHIGCQLANQYQQLTISVHLLLAMSIYFDVISDYPTLDPVYCIAGAALDTIENGFSVKLKEACYKRLKSIYG